MRLVSFLLCLLFSWHSPDKNGYCIHCGVKVRED